MIGQPKPVGTLLILLIGWVGVRAAVLVQSIEPVQTSTIAIAEPKTAPVPSRINSALTPSHPTAGRQLRIALGEPDQVMAPMAKPLFKMIANAPLANRVTIILDDPVSVTMAAVRPAESQFMPPSRARGEAPTSSASGLRMSSWISMRGGQSSPGLAGGGQLGASQIGIRAVLPVVERSSQSRFGLAARASMPLATSREKEGALGLVYQQDGIAPIEFGIERRFALSRGGRNAFALYAATGVNDLALGSDWSLNGYAQAGVVGLRSRDGFIDGAFALERGMLSGEGLTAKVGLGAWGAAQPRVSRFDIGPVATLKAGNMRISASYRFRVAGNASPKSGPSITIGTDF